MAVDKNGKKLPSGIRQRPNGSYEVQVSRNGKSYSAYAKTITEAKKIKVDVSSNSRNPKQEPLKNNKIIFSYTNGNAKEEKQLMKHIALTTEEAVDLNMYFALTHQRITDEIEVWESLKGNPTAPAAGNNLIFWKKMETLINRVSKELQ